MAANFLMRLPPVATRSLCARSPCSRAVLAVSSTCFGSVSGAAAAAAAAPPRNASAKLCSVSFCHLQLPVAAAAKVFKLCAHLQRLVATVRVAVAAVVVAAVAAVAALAVAVACRRHRKWSLAESVTRSVLPAGWPEWGGWVVGLGSWVVVRGHVAWWRKQAVQTPVVPQFAALSVNDAATQQEQSLPACLCRCLCLCDLCIFARINLFMHLFIFFCT